MAWTQTNSDLKPAGTQATDSIGRQVAGGAYAAFMSGASSSPGSYTDTETGKSFTSEAAMRDFQWKRAHGQA